jgi:hypothetical protein
MAQLTGNKIKDTYLGLLKTNGSGILTSGFQRITDGSGLGSQLYLSLTQIKFHDAYIFPNADGSADQVLSTDGSGVLSWKDDANSGTVTSVALSVPTGLTVTNSPITTSGTIAIANTSGYSIPTDAKQTQWDTAYTNRITTATSPLSITTNTISLNTVPVSNGGTGATTLTGILLGDGTNTITAITDGSADTFLKTDGSGGYSFSDVGGGDVLKTGTIAQNKIAIWNDNDSTLRSDPTLTIDADHKITLFQPDPSGNYISNYNIGGGNQGIATGANNIGFGINNLNSLTTGYSNIAIGYGLQGTTTGYENICLGSNSLFYNDIGSRNICIGISSLFNNRSGTYNISIGYQSLVTTQTGINNIGIGKYSLQYSTGSGNIAIGSNSGSALATGSNNVIIGTATGSTINGLSNCIIISDGGGNIRQTFDASGDATFIGATFSGALSGTSAVFTANEALTINANNSTAANNTITGFSANLYAISVRQKGVSAGIGGTNYMAQIISALGSEGLEIYTPNAKELILGTNSVPRLTIASTGAATFSGGYLSVSGNVATNNPPSSQGLSFGWNKSNGYGESLITYTNIGGGTVPRLDFGYWNGSTYSTQTTIFNSGNFLIGSSITDAGYKLDVDGTARFSGNITAANSSLFVGISAGSYGAKITVQSATSYTIESRRTGTGGEGHLVFQNGNGAVGSIFTSGSTTLYNTSSDYRLKENATPITDALSRVNQLKPIRFNFIANADRTVDGFLAHEVKDIIPEAISGEKDALNEDGTPHYQGIDQSKIVPLLVAAIQEQQAIIEDLKARIEKLEV